MMQVSADSITVDETLPARSRTFAPEVVAQVHKLLTEQNVQNVGIGTFEEEGPARSALTTLNRLLKAAHGVGPYAGTVRRTDGGHFKAVLLNRPARKVERKATGKKAAARPAAAA
jgi:hypothetical protein